ncbi:hypothetical protein [Pelagibacterium halotolerans]|uniref:hypothetical protein n=1 Tax=Pelagibacterium halotolerans TaxID=531813 RepID=UPI00384DF455
MSNLRLIMIAGGLLLAVLLLLGAGLSATEFGLVMLGGALVVAVVMFILTRRQRSRRIRERDRSNRIPPKL